MMGACHSMLNFVVRNHVKRPKSDRFDRDNSPAGSFARKARLLARQATVSRTHRSTKSRSIRSSRSGAGNCSCSTTTHSSNPWRDKSAGCPPRRWLQRFHLPPHPQHRRIQLQQRRRVQRKPCRELVPGGQCCSMGSHPRTHRLFAPTRLRRTGSVFTRRINSLRASHGAPTPSVFTFCVEAHSASRPDAIRPLL